MGLIPLEERRIVPQRLESVPSAYPSQDPKLGWPVSELVYDLELDARKAGFKAPQFQIISGFRDAATQERLWRKALAAAGGDTALARKTTAPPGNSSHFSGFAFDIFLGVGGTEMSRAPSQFKSKEYKYMRDVLAPKYNLTQLDVEPWHWECDQACREAYLLNKYGTSQVSEIPSQAQLLSVDAPTKPSKKGKYVLLASVGVLVGVGAWYLTTRKSETII